LKNIFETRIVCHKCLIFFEEKFAREKQKKTVDKKSPQLATA
jgi:hypothetical protein